jgi:predicted nucleic acid-binding protein
MKSVVFDTGPLVAWFCPRDEYHGWALQTFSQLPLGGIICEAVLAEACHLAAKDGVPRNKVVEFVERGELSVASVGSELAVIRQLLEHYSDTPMDFADACVVRLAELHPNSLVCTLDKHFQVFRKNKKDVVPVLAPFAK